LDRLSEIDAEMSKPFEDPVPVRRGKDEAIVTNCSTCLELLARHYEPPLDRDLQVLRAIALRCLALKALSTATQSAKSYLSELHFDELPPVLAIAVSSDQVKRRQEAQDKQLSWSQFDPAARANAEADDTLHAQGAGWEQRLQILERGDFNGDGLEDWLVRDEAWMTQGTYRSVRMFLLTRLGPGERLRVIRELVP
jgi:hypothetical protein